MNCPLDGEAYGRVQYLRNIGSAHVPEYVDVGWVEGIPAVDGTNPAIGIGDLDSDGDLDVVRVSQETDPEGFENLGVQSIPTFMVNDGMLNGVVTAPTGYGAGVDLVDIDADGDPDMILARGYGQNLLFLNEGATPVESVSWGAIKALYR